MAGRGHHAVIHPSVFLAAEKRAVARVNDWLATRLALVFGLVWTVWVFMVFPLVLLLLPKGVQNTGFFISSGWIQLWALPLFVYVGNRLQKSADAQSDAQHDALTHIAVTGDDVKTLLAQNTELTQEVRDLTGEVHRLVARQS